MHVLHVTAHLGGGVGKAHAALRAAMPAGIRQTYLLLEEPRDRRYADEIASQGGEIVFARDLAEVAELCATADIVQFEFWNHPKLFECLARTAFPPLRTVFWAHVSGLFRPVIAPGFFNAVDRFVFTTPASLVLSEGLAEDERWRLSSIGSGFGFSSLPIASAIPPSALPGISPTRGENDSRLWHRADRNIEISASERSQPLSPLEGEMSGRTEGGISSLDAEYPITYLGTVDFIKMHPGFFDAIDALSQVVEVAVWGGYDPAGDVAAKARSLRHPERIRFMGQTSDPQAALRQSAIFFYPLQPDHYGTAENALIEAMSRGLVPVVLANPAECAIIEHGVTGFIGTTIADCADILDRLLVAPDVVREVGARAAALVAEHYTAEHSSAAFGTLWAGLITEPKRVVDFAAVIGDTPLDWYVSTQQRAGEDRDPLIDTGTLSKGTLSHFRAAFPDDPCWAALSDR